MIFTVRMKYLKQDHSTTLILLLLKPLLAKVVQDVVVPFLLLNNSWLKELYVFHKSISIKNY